MHGLKGFLLSLSLFLLLFSYTTQVLAQNKIDVALQEQLEVEGNAPALVLFGDFPDLSGAKALITKEEKGQFVFDALRQNAQRHENILADLRQQRLAYQHYWAANAIYIPKATTSLVAQLEAQDDVQRIAALANWSLDLPAQPSVQVLDSRSATPEWGIEYMNVPAVWNQGIRGKGAVVGGQDTGYDWDHPALVNTYRGLDSTGAVDHNYNWHDSVHDRNPLNDDDNNPCGFDSRVPCDDGNHGTHTMGTMVGLDGPNEIGVAPEAKWVGCRNMDRSWGQPQSYLECFQWYLAPTDLDGENPRPEMAPDVIANSWYCPLMEGCDSTTYPAFDNITTALRAAGVVVVVSAGNAGRGGCNTINRIPAQSPGVISVGAHDVNGAIAGFSSRGVYDPSGTNRIRPDIAAPGVDVRSSVPGTDYRSFNGTSMAGPHVAGLVALMISANPALRGQVDTIEAILLRTATPALAPASDSCSAPNATSPNNVFGHGYANAEAAVVQALAYQDTTGVSDVKAFAKTLDVTVAPNPIGRGFTLVLPAQVQQGQLVIQDATGRVVLSRKTADQQIDVYSGAWAPGTYVYRFTGAEGTASGKLVKL